MIESIADNVEEIEEEYLILRDLCIHPNIPSFHGIYLKKAVRREEDQLWFVMEVRSPFTGAERDKRVYKNGTNSILFSSLCQTAL